LVAERNRHELIPAIHGREDYPTSLF
jgi:hypothetical protein